MKTVSLNLFTINELPSDQAKDKARNWYRECDAGDTYWSESTIDEAIEQGTLLGIDFKERSIPLRNGKTCQEPCIWWSGFSSQGDGACFEGTWRAKDVKADQVADGWGDAPETTEIKRIAAEFAALAALYPDASFTVKHADYYCHERSVDYGFDNFPDGEIDEDWPHEKRPEYEAAIEELKEAARDFMRWIYRALERDYTYHNSDECIDETLDANEYTFLEDGTRFEA